MEQERLQIVDIVNKIFGESGWSFSISNVTLDYIDDSRSGNYSASASAVVRVQRSNGVFRDDVGCGTNWGPNKADVISRAKRDAITNGLKGAVINFGGDLAQQVNTVTPRKSTIESRAPSTNRGTSSIAQSHAQPIAQLKSPLQTTSPPQATVKPNSFSRSLGEKLATNPPSAPVTPSTTATTLHPKSVPVPVPTKQTPLLQPSSPLAVPLPQQPQAPIVPQNTLSEEELAKIERKKRQKQLQEEFRKKHLLEQAQAQSKAQDKGASKPVPQSNREPLKEQQTRNQPSTSSRGDGPNGPNGGLDVDDDVMLSTQDMEAISAIAANNTNISRHSPILSSPSITRNFVLDAQSNKSTGSKRPDLTSYAFNPEKRPRSEQKRY